MRKLTIALDWTPNINHIGFFIAQEYGFFEENGLEVQLIDPSIDDYAVTPAKKVELGTAQLALCPLESIISYQTKKNSFTLKAIAAIFQQDISAIAVNADSGISRPAQLDGKTYASYKARYEDYIVQQMIKNDGGTGNLNVHYPDKLGIWNTLLDGGFDAAWIFTNWEGADRRLKVDSLRLFEMKDYSVPYSYSPVIATSDDLIRQEPELLRSFLKATLKGYAVAVENPNKTVELLSGLVSKSDQHIDLGLSLERSKLAFGLGGNWGQMDHQNVQSFIDWIQGTGIETSQLKAEDLFTNELLDK